MGLAASQGRLLSLTARNHDLVYEGQQISQQRLMLAEASQEAAQKYNAAMNNTIMQGTVNGKTELLTYDLITGQDPFSGLCMRLVDTNGNVVIPGESLEVQKSVKNGETEETSMQTTGIFSSASDFINVYMSDLSSDKKTELSSYTLADISKYYNESYEKKDENITVIHRNKSTSHLIKEGEKALFDPNVSDPAYIQKMLFSGEFKLQQAQADGSFEDLVWQGSTMISEVFDTSDDAAAEAEYEEAMKTLQKQDKMLEMRLNQVETQQEAVNKEIESARKVIDDNVAQSFKTFTA